MEECNIISIGSNNQWGSKEEVIWKLLNCVTHIFDYILENNQPKRKPNSDKVLFYPYYIGDNTINTSNVT